MSSTTAAVTAANARRRALTTLFGALGLPAHTPAPSLKRPGKPAVDTRLASVGQSGDAALLATAGPPPAVAWLGRATFGCTQADLSAFNALAVDDAARWSAWLDRQFNRLDDDSACTARIAGANFQSLAMTADQLWSTFHADTSDYTHRMLPVAETECMTLIRQIYSKHQLFEVMVDFWHDHFSVFGWDYDGGPLFPAFDALFRDTSAGNGVFGNFKSLLVNVCKSASMMYMLDLYSSTAAGPNENYARELCELHTLGAINYAGVVEPDELTGQYDLPTAIAADGGTIRMQYVDNDVYQVTSALTGWTLSGSTWPYGEIDNQPLGTFAFDNGAHYKYQLFFLNRYIAANTGMTGGQHVFDWLAAHPGVAKFISTKLCRRLVGDNPSPTLVDSVAQVFLQNYLAPNQLQLTTQAVLTSPEFLASWGQKMKRPGVALVGALRTTGADFTPLPNSDNPDYVAGQWTTTDSILWALQGAGHRPFYWPAPNGYPDTSVAWASTGTLGMTLRMLAYAIESTQNRNVSGSPYLADVQGQTLAQFPNAADRTAANLATYWCNRILGYVPSNVYNAALDLMRQNALATDALDLTTDHTTNGNPDRTGTWNSGNLSKHYTIARLRSMVTLILCSPEFLSR
jgi:uncharacterized protein (DUF1800 family)